MPTFSFEIPELIMDDAAEYSCEMDGVEVGRGHIVIDGMSLYLFCHIFPFISCNKTVARLLLISFWVLRTRFIVVFEVLFLKYFFDRLVSKAKDVRDLVYFSITEYFTCVAHY